MNTESSSSIIPTSSSSSSSLLAPAGLVAAVTKPKEEEPPLIVSSSSLPLQAATSGHLKQDVKAEVKAEAIDPAVNSNEEARVKEDWEPGNWCWLLDEHDTFHTTVETASVRVAVKEEEDAEAVTEEETEIKSQQGNDDVASAPHVAFLFSSSPPTPGIRSTKEETKENYNHKLRRREDEEVTEKGLQSEQEDDATVPSASQFVASSVSSDSSTTGIEPEKGIKVRLDDDDDDDTNNHKNRHSTDRIVTSNRKNDHSGSGNTTITTSRSIDSFDENWRTGSWCWERPTTNSGSRRDVFASVLAGSTVRGKKRKASEQFLGSRFDDRIQNGETRNDQCSLDNANVVTNRSFDRQHHDPDDDNWTTSCWCWEPSDTNSGINVVALTAAASTSRREKQKGSEQSRKTRYIIPSKHQSNIGHHNNNKSTDINEDDDADDILEFHGDHDDDGTDSNYDSNYDSVDGDDGDDNESVSDTASCGHSDALTRLKLHVNDIQWMEMFKRLVAYKKQYKTTCVPFVYLADPQLGRWVNRQRSNFNSNKPRLTADRITQLDLIGFVWNSRDAQWTEMCERLVKYKKQNKTTCVPQFYPADSQLGTWVRKQRSCYKTNDPCLTADRITHLDSIGFVWNVRDAYWMEMYDRLVKYEKQNKTTCVPKLYIVDVPLGNWVQQQRSNYHTNKSRLTADRMSRLNSIGFVWKMKTNDVNL